MTHHLLKAGFGRRDITPEPGCVLNGFIARLSPSRGVDAPLSARALFLEQGHRKAVIVGLDLLGLTPQTADRLTEKISRRIGLPESNVVLSATHTHSGPMSVPLRGLGPADSLYLEELEHKVVDAAVEAAAEPLPVEADWGTAVVALGINRRQPAGDGTVELGVNPEGPYDRHVRVLRLRGARRTILLFEHASHPYCLGPDDLLISADFWGHAAAILEEAGFHCLYLNGCAGNLSPRQAFGGPAAAREEGRRLAEAVRRAAGESRHEAEPALAIGSRRFDLAYDDLPPLSEIDVQIRQPDRTVRKEDRSRSLVQTRLRRAWKEWRADLTAALKNGPLPPLQVRVSVLRLGRGALIFLPGEVFFETGERIAASLPADPAAVAAYSHGYIGYVPTSEAYSEGGYEVNESHRYVGLWRLHPDSGDRLVRAALDLWNDLAASF